MLRAWRPSKRCGPIGIDLGQTSVKLVQFDADRTHLLAASRWDLPPAKTNSSEERDAHLVDALNRAREGRAFVGREAALCLGARELVVQNIRVVKSPGEGLDKIVRQEAANRLPFSLAEAELRYLEAADVRQGESIKREVILLACKRTLLERLLGIAERAGLTPVAVDVEPASLLRCYLKQYRREDDKQQRLGLLHVGASNTVVVIGQGEEVLFIKYLDLGGRHMDEAVSQHLKMPLPEATALRRHNGDRRADQQDPEVTRSVAESIRPVLDKLTNEISLCLRYHSVTFRGQPLTRLVLSGGEAGAALAEFLNQRLEVRCEPGEPLRSYEASQASGRTTQWDIAAGLALWDSN